MAESDRPGLVVFCIITDGAENASREFTKAKIKEMIEHQTTAYKWQFTFLGSNQDAFAEAGGIGIPKAAALGYGEEKTSGGIRLAAMNVSRMRSACSAGLVPDNAYSAEERAMVAK